ncbi:MAG TPA: DUF1365 domain-containing protein [Solirubrobacterales bacterium]|nr:DUF1365 domain-containing protein [Solirubrobacterales bacterium]
MSASAVYEGWLRHRRFEPIAHSFRYRVFMAYLDLDELPDALDPFPLWSARRPAPAQFRRDDFMGNPARPLAECVRDAVESRAGTRPGGPVRLLANLRYFGHIFNPVCFYYCFDPAGERVEAVVADVNNIPWGESHPYVLMRGGQRGPVLAERLEKALHVSPLMGMDQTYAFHATEPAEGLIVHIESRANGEEAKAFDATLSMRRRELSAAVLTKMLARYPVMSLQVVGRIYAQALRLKLKGARYFPHPGGRRPRGFLSP